MGSLEFDYQNRPANCWCFCSRNLVLCLIWFDSSNFCIFVSFVFLLSLVFPSTFVFVFRTLQHKEIHQLSTANLLRKKDPNTIGEETSKNTSTSDTFHIKTTTWLVSFENHPFFVCPPVAPGYVTNLLQDLKLGRKNNTSLKRSRSSGIN